MNEIYYRVLSMCFRMDHAVLISVVSALTNVVPIIGLLPIKKMSKAYICVDWIYPDGDSCVAVGSKKVYFI